MFRWRVDEGRLGVSEPSGPMPPCIRVRQRRSSIRRGQLRALTRTGGTADPSFLALSLRYLDTTHEQPRVEATEYEEDLPTKTRISKKAMANRRSNKTHNLRSGGLYLLKNVVDGNECSSTRRRKTLPLFPLNDLLHWRECQDNANRGGNKLTSSRQNSVRELKVRPNIHPP